MFERQRNAEIAEVDLRHHALASLVLNISRCLGLNATEPKGDTKGRPWHPTVHQRLLAGFYAKPSAIEAWGLRARAPC